MAKHPQKGRRMTESQKAEMRRMYEGGMTRSAIQKHFGVHWYTVLRAISSRPPVRGVGTRRYTRWSSYPASGGRRESIGPEVPTEVLAERNRAYAAPVSLTAMVMGDPLPGRSALEARR